MSEAEEIEMDVEGIKESIARLRQHREYMALAKPKGKGKAKASAEVDLADLCSGITLPKKGGE